MERNEVDRRLSQISTAWTLLGHAHTGPADRAADARRRLLDRYGAPIYRYLLGALRDPDAADEAYQEFALRLVRGDLRNASPERGRFRSFVKTTLYHLVADLQRRDRGRPGLPTLVEPEAPSAEDEGRFLDDCRAELMLRAWDALAESDRVRGTFDHPLLRLRTDEPGLDSAGLAARLSALVGREITVAAVRKRLHLARERFVDLLIDEVARTSGDDSAAIEDDLIELGLHEYCRSGLQRRRPG